MGAVDFSKSDIESFVSNVYYIKGKLQREKEEAESASSFVDGVVNQLLDKAESCLSSMTSDCEYAGMVYRSNCSKIKSLREEMSSLGTGDDPTGRREAIKSEIKDINSINSELSALQSALRSKMDGIERCMTALRNARDKIRDASKKVHKVCNEAESKLTEIESKAKTACGYAEAIAKKLSLGVTVRDGRICFTSTAAVKSFSATASENARLMSEKSRSLMRAAVTMKENLQAEISTAAVQISEELIHYNELIHTYLDRVSSSFAEAARLLSAYESL